MGLKREIIGRNNKQCRIEKCCMYILSEQTGMKLSCIKPMSKVRGLSIEPCSSTVCID